MINSKGETIYTNAEVAYELGISPSTVNAIAKRLYGGSRIAHWTINDVKRIAEYAKSITLEEDAKRLAVLHEVIQEVMGGVKLDPDEKMRAQVNKDLHGAN